VGLLDYYKQFDGLSHEEVNAGLREEARERRAKALSVLEPVDLSRTTWPEYPPSNIANAITYAARRGLHRYLDRHASELRAELAHYVGIGTDRLAVGDGVAQLLSAATQALMEPGDELITPWPSYGLYPLMARRARGGAVPVPGFGADAILAAVNDRTRIVALCNPNDPTGELLDVEALDGLLGALPERVIVLLDEALRDFVDAEPIGATMALLERHPRLLIFRTFSKAWGLAGLRCGYVVGGPESEALLERLAPELGVNELAQAGALEALRSLGPVVARRASLVTGARSALIEELAGRGLTVTPSQANVVWSSAPGLDGAELSARLERGGITVAPGGQLGAPTHVRITVPTRPVDSERLLRVLDAALSQ
jgi:histidinol-phosphate aminotransferase